MKRAYLFVLIFILGLAPVAGLAQSGDVTPPPPASSSRDAADQTDHTVNNAAVAAGKKLNLTETAQPSARIPHAQLIERAADSVLRLLNVSTSGNTWQRYCLALLVLATCYLVRRVVVRISFAFLGKLASRTKSNFDDKLFPALEAPTAMLIMLLGIFGALWTLKLPAGDDTLIDKGATVAFSLCGFWFLLRALSSLLDHLHEVAIAREAGVADFMPWIRKTLITLFVIFSLLMTAESLNFNVTSLLAGLGIGGLAFALAAQDTIANLFGAVVVATDQPFKIGESVRIGANTGAVEDIGLRSTRLRSPDKSIIVIPNKTVAAETVTNLSRFTQRRNEQVIGLTYDTPAEKMEAMVEEIKRIILADNFVDPASVMVYFRDYSASSLDIWLVYATKDGDFQRFMQAKQRVNLAIMRAVQARGLSFAFPTQTLELGETAAKTLAPRSEPGPGRQDAGR